MKKIDERFKTGLNVSEPHGALNGISVAMKKPKKSGSEYFNFKDFFPGAASPGQCRLQIPLCRCWVKWIFTVCSSDFYQQQVEGKC